MNTFKPEVLLHKAYAGQRDNFKLHVYACNYIGLCLTIFGYGLEIRVQVHKPRI